MLKPEMMIERGMKKGGAIGEACHLNVFGGA